MACSVTQGLPAGSVGFGDVHDLRKEEQVGIRVADACAIFVGPQESKLLHSCSPRASEDVSDCSRRTENPSRLASVANHGMCP